MLKLSVSQHTAYLFPANPSIFYGFAFPNYVISFSLKTFTLQLLFKAIWCSSKKPFCHWAYFQVQHSQDFKQCDCNRCFHLYFLISWWATAAVSFRPWVLLSSDTSKCKRLLPNRSGKYKVRVYILNENKIKIVDDGSKDTCKCVVLQVAAY